MRRSHEGCSLCSIAKSTIVFLLIPLTLLFSDVVNLDRPLKGEWNLDLREVWEIDRAGPEVSRRNFQAIDIFSPEGRYLFRSKITVEEGLRMTPHQSANPLLTDDHLYVGLVDKDLNVRIRKYKIILPEPERD
ncbi:MAG: hypothetical protein WAU81_15480 [Candidatus Aminicenantales bacterium]